MKTLKCRACDYNMGMIHIKNQTKSITVLCSIELLTSTPFAKLVNKIFSFCNEINALLWQWSHVAYNCLYVSMGQKNIWRHSLLFKLSKPILTQMTEKTMGFNILLQTILVFSTHPSVECSIFHQDSFLVYGAVFLGIVTCKLQPNISPIFEKTQ